MTIEQLTLGVQLHDEATFVNYWVGDNANILQALQNLLINNPTELFIYLCGPLASGRSHLLQATCHAARALGLQAIYLTLADRDLAPAMLQDLEQFDLICLDDIDAVYGNPIWEEAIFYLYNRVREKHHRLVVAGNQPPALSHCQLPDLRSRLSWGLVFQVALLDDAQKQAALQLRARQRGLTLDDETSLYLLRHFSRDMQQLTQALDQLDRASLAHKRKITIPFLKQILLP